MALEPRWKDVACQQVQLRCIAKEVTLSHGQLGQHGIARIPWAFESSQQGDGFADAKRTHRAPHSCLRGRLAIVWKHEAGVQLGQFRDARERRVGEARHCAAR